MLNFLKTFNQTDTNKYAAQIRNTQVTFYLKSAISMVHNTFRIDNGVMGASLYGVDWKTIESIIDITDPITEENND